ncbi:MAG: hypothetical protein Alpg2KO_22230 [Alphaproteobacteria bacterium]
MRFRVFMAAMLAIGLLIPELALANIAGWRKKGFPSPANPNQVLIAGGANSVREGTGLLFACDPTIGLMAFVTYSLDKTTSDKRTPTRIAAKVTGQDTQAFNATEIRSNGGFLILGTEAVRFLRYIYAANSHFEIQAEGRRKLGVNPNGMHGALYPVLSACNMT